MEPNAKKTGPLEAVLVFNELRARLQKSAARDFLSPLVSLTVNYPGFPKKNAVTELIFGAAASALSDMFAAEELRVLCGTRAEEHAGYWALWAVEAEAARLKRLCADIEESHPLGRLFDIDVLDAGAVPISRRTLGLPARTCLICGGNVALCRRRAMHSEADLKSLIERMVNEWNLLNSSNTP